jgi:heme exporter protein B
VAIALKDFRLEVRSKQALPLSVALSLLIVVTDAFSDGGGAESTGPLWVAFVFAGTLAVMQTISLETRNDAFEGLLLAPIDRTAIYLGKVLSTTAFVTIVGIVTLLALVVFHHVSIVGPTLPALLLVLVLFSLGFSAVGVLIGLLTAATDISALLVPVLLVPLVFPGLLAGVGFIEGGATSWITVLVSYDGIVLTAGVLVFGELVR